MGHFLDLTRGSRQNGPMSSVPKGEHSSPSDQASEACASSGKAPRRLPSTTDATAEAAKARRARLAEEGIEMRQISGEGPEIAPEELAGSIEGFVGFARIPIGVAGPVRINGSAARGDFFIPLATTEGSLVASYQHAFNAMNRAGGVSVLCTRERVGRAPCFEFANLAEAGEFATWLPSQFGGLQGIVSGRSRFCRLAEIQHSIVGNSVYLLLEFTTGDAAGQNMVTAAAQAVCAKLLEDMPVKPRRWWNESTMSGDKRATASAFRTRGRNVNAEIVLPAKYLGRYYQSEPAHFVRTWHQAMSGSAQIGAIGLQANVANTLAALFIACGQDVACVSEAVTGLTRVELTPEGDVYISVTLPNLIVGTVGGGTYLPTARECLTMMGCYGTGKVRKFAEICAALALAGELALVGVISSGAFAQAHASATEARKPRAGP